MSKVSLFHNIQRQAKRTSRAFGIPLSNAKDLISRVIYQCHNFGDLKEKLYSNSLKSAVYPYCQIHPRADRHLISFLCSRIDCLERRFVDELSTALIHLEVTSLIYRIFGFTHSATLTQEKHKIRDNKIKLAEHFSQAEFGKSERLSSGSCVRALKNTGYGAF